MYAGRTTHIGGPDATRSVGTCGVLLQVVFIRQETLTDSRVVHG